MLRLMRPGAAIAVTALDASAQYATTQSPSQSAKLRVRVRGWSGCAWRDGAASHRATRRPNQTHWVGVARTAVLAPRASVPGPRNARLHGARSRAMNWAQACASTARMAWSSRVSSAARRAASRMKSVRVLPLDNAARSIRLRSAAGMCRLRFSRRGGRAGGGFHAGPGCGMSRLVQHGVTTSSLHSRAAHGSTIRCHLIVFLPTRRHRSQPCR